MLNKFKKWLVTPIESNYVTEIVIHATNRFKGVSDSFGSNLGSTQYEDERLQTVAQRAYDSSSKIDAIIFMIVGILTYWATQSVVMTIGILALDLILDPIIEYVFINTVEKYGIVNTITPSSWFRAVKDIALSIYNWKAIGCVATVVA